MFVEKSVTMKNSLLAMKRLASRTAFTPDKILNRSCSGGKPSPVFELRTYTIHPKHFKSVMGLYNTDYHMRTKHSKLFGFWTSEIGDNISQFVHIWEYESLSQRRQVRIAMGNDEVWNSQFLPKLLPGLSQWKNSLLVTSPGTTLNLDFSKDPAAVYLLDRVQEDKQPLDHAGEKTAPGELLVGTFSEIIGSRNIGYRLWRYSDIDTATQSSITRAADLPFEGTTMLLYPTKFSPLS